MSGFRGLMSVVSRRGFRCSATNFCANKKPVSGSGSLQSTPANSESKTGTEDPTGRFVGEQKRIPTSLDRIYLVWSGQFKSRDEIPAKLDMYQIVKAREWGRIRVNIYILILAAGLSVIAVYSGKQAAKRGETIEGANLAWHKQINEEYRKEQAGKKKE